MIRLKGISKQYHGRKILEDISFSVADADRISLVGGNGAGKTTLLRIICGDLPPDSGEVIKKKGLAIGYLPQTNAVVPQGTVLHACLSARDDLLEIGLRIAEIEEQLEQMDDPQPPQEVLCEYDRLWEEYTHAGGVDINARAARVLTGLGFKEEEFDRDVDELSGGWRMRLALAGLLLQNPDLMLLDEPTNHLDLEARNWLIDHLKECGMGFILVSHDRHFLDATTQKTFELSSGTIERYPCAYSAYLEQAEEKRRQRRKAYVEQQEEIERLKRFIRRFHAQPVKASQVRDRVHKLERLKLVEPPRTVKTMSFNFPMPSRGPRILLSLDGVRKAFGANELFCDLHLDVERGDRIALVGPNGVGKSTLMRILAGKEPIDSGRRIVSPGVEIGYFSQDTLRTLNRDRTVLDELASVAQAELIPRLRTLLGGFLFHGDDVFKTVGVLSGGEMTRLAIAKMLIHSVNILLLDEPTNNLDIPSMEALISALQQYPGSLVFVSHDRYFINALANRTGGIEDRSLHVRYGNYEDWLEYKGQAHAPACTAARGIRGRASEPASAGKRQWEKSKRIKANVRAVQRAQRQNIEELSGIEATISELESALRSKEDLLVEASSRADTETLKNASIEHQKIKADLEVLYWKWEETSRRIEELKKRTRKD